MNARRYGRGEWIVRVIGPWSEWKRAIWRDVYRVQAWWFRNGPAVGLLFVGVLIVVMATTAVRTVSIYAPNPHAPFLTSAVRG